MRKSVEDSHHKAQEMKSNGVEATRNLIKILLIVVAQTGKFFEPKSCDKYGEKAQKSVVFVSLRERNNLER